MKGKRSVQKLEIEITVISTILSWKSLRNKRVHKGRGESTTNKA